MEKQDNIHSLLQILIFGKADASFLVLSNFTWFSNFWKSFLSLIVVEVNIEKILVSDEFGYGKN